jgi:hypothetical protein
VRELLIYQDIEIGVHGYQLLPYRIFFLLPDPLWFRDKRTAVTTNILNRRHRRYEGRLSRDFHLRRFLVSKLGMLVRIWERGEGDVPVRNIVRTNMVRFDVDGRTSNL